MTKYAAYGTLLKRESSPGSGTYVTVPGTGDIEGPDIKNNFEDVTTHDGVSSFEEFIATLQSGGSVKSDLVWDPNDSIHAALHLDQAGRVKTNYQVVYPTSPAKTASFAAYVEDFSIKAPVKGKLMRSLSLKISGGVTIA
jgi:hypothetical protein